MLTIKLKCCEACQVIPCKFQYIMSHQVFIGKSDGTMEFRQRYLALPESEFIRQNTQYNGKYFNQHEEVVLQNLATAVTELLKRPSPRRLLMQDAQLNPEQRLIIQSNYNQLLSELPKLMRIAEHQARVAVRQKHAIFNDVSQMFNSRLKTLRSAAERIDIGIPKDASRQVYIESLLKHPTIFRNYDADVIDAGLMRMFADKN